MIFSWIKPQQAEAEAVLTSALTVASAAITAVLGEDRDHLVGKIDNRLIDIVLDLQLLFTDDRLASLPSCDNPDDDLSIRHGSDEASAVDLDHPLRNALVGNA